MLRVDERRALVSSIDCVTARSRIMAIKMEVLLRPMRRRQQRPPMNGLLLLLDWRVSRLPHPAPKLHLLGQSFGFVNWIVSSETRRIHGPTPSSRNGRNWIFSRSATAARFGVTDQADTSPRLPNSGRGLPGPRSGPGDFRRRLLPWQPSGTETKNQPAPIVLLAIVEVLLEVCGRNIRDETNQLRNQSLCLVRLAPKAT
jgi:hypothetical protein